MRIDYVDWLKGLSILLVVIFHTPGHLPIFDFPFRMPLFFMLSGIFFKVIPMREHASRKFFQLILPFLIFYLIGYFHNFLYYHLNPYNDPWPPEQIIELIDPRTRGYASNSPLWFITALLINQLILWILVTALHNRLAVMASCLFFAFAAWQVIHPDRAYYLILRAFIFLPFYALGHLWGKKFLRLIEGSTGRRLSIMAGCVVLIALSAWMCEYEHLCHTLKFFPQEYILLASLCVLAVVLARYLCRLKAFRWFYFLGRNSYIILGLHYLILWDLYLLLEETFGYGINHILFLPLVVLTMLSLIPFIRVINRYAPVIGGKYMPEKLRRQARGAEQIAGERARPDSAPGVR